MAKTQELIGILGVAQAGIQVIKDCWNSKKQKGIVKCPKCETKIRNMREFTGLWHCKKCDATWTGGAWESSTARGKESHRIAVRMARELAETKKK